MDVHLGVNSAVFRIKSDLPQKNVTIDPQCRKLPDMKKRSLSSNPKRSVPFATSLILYCRPGFENECAAEITDKAQQKGHYGFAKTTRQRGYVLFTCYEPSDAAQLMMAIPFRSLIFARQFFGVLSHLKALPATDRITPIQTALGNDHRYGDVRVETADSEEGKSLAGFCRKFTVPLRRALRDVGVVSKTENRIKPVLHVFFAAPGEVYLGYSYPMNNSPFYMGIPRLKFPADAPSRSTLKLEEAFYVFVPYDEWDERLAAGMRAVDLGASPGGWTYQLVKRYMMVSAVDNGPMDVRLMETGQVKHFREDGFKFVPKRNPIQWLVCDMVEKPNKVTELMGKWLVNGWCREAIFNLKLPMKKRYESVDENLTFLKKIFDENGIHALIQAKQLYHDREEITVHVQCIWGQGITQK